ncbi:MAG: pseudouridine-5'-phosphate glycosidase [Nocardioidaceae bacterium]|nr:pseudouridine-5'-phosphate glycosidase [Nocardioidaceae bacterium]
MTAPPLDLSAPVAAALAEGRPVVALESTIIAHGLPRPRNLQAARDFEAILSGADVVAATIAVLDGRLCVGLDDAQLERVASDPDMAKLSVRDLPIVMARRGSGATTVAATSYVAAMAGVRVFATGGLGGVHREASSTFDESNDLPTLASTPITVVSAGVKSILDIGATLERLETLGVTVVGYGTDAFPSFWVTDSGHRLDWSVPDAPAVADVMAAQDALGRRSAVLVANPLPVDQQLDPALHDRSLADALAAAAAEGVTGKAVSPFLLDAMVGITDGRSLEVNLAIAANNVTVAGQIATAWSRLGAGA